MELARGLERGPMLAMSGDEALAALDAELRAERRAGRHVERRAGL